MRIDMAPTDHGTASRANGACPSSARPGLMPDVSMRALLPALLLPPLLLVLVALAGALLVPWYRRTGALMAGVAAGLLLVLATPMAAGLLRASLERDAIGPVPAVTPAAIVVLGAEVVRGTAGPDIGPMTLERLRAAAALQRRTGLPLLVSAGPLARGELPLSQLMARSLRVDFAVPVRWVEDRSRTTGENATLSSAMLSGAGIGAAYLVTHAWHLPRAMEEFTAAGLPVVAAPVRMDRVPEGVLSDFLPRADRLAESWWSIREWAGRLVRRLEG
jgi:uncharacterized SAM-binding protein YcdF (DUF218 family)